MQIHDNSSITFNGRVYDKQELEKLSLLLMSNIAKFNLKKDEVVAIAMNRSHWTVVAMLTLRNLGIPYLILNCTLPQNRIDYMLDTVRVSCIISDDLNKMKFDGYRIISVDSLEECFNSIEPLGSEIMYLAFTSGSTGKPKAIAVRNEGFNFFVQAFVESGAFDGITKCVCMSDFGFDVIYCETIIPLEVGISIILTSEDEQESVRKRCAIIEDNNAEFIQCTPSTLNMMRMTDESMTFLDNVKTIILGGEALPETLLKALGNKKNLKIMNYYGPTETTVWSTFSDLTGKTTVNIGKPLSNTTIYILDEENKLVNDGESGEICIGGKSLAAGYFNNNEATEKAFITYNGERVYKSGDLGYIKDGVIYCHGRKDFQIKIRGHRIELGEIDSCMMQIQGIKDSVTTTYTTQTGAELISFYVGDEALPDNEIKSRLGEFLPDYMVPAVIVKRDEFVHTPNGKTDCRAMVEEYLKMAVKSSESAFDSTDDAVFSELICVIREKTFACTNEITPLTKFSEVGINSVAYVSIVVHFEEKYDFEFDDDYLNTNAFETLGNLADYIRQFAVDG